MNFAEYLNNHDLDNLTIKFSYEIEGKVINYNLSRIDAMEDRIMYETEQETVIIILNISYINTLLQLPLCKDMILEIMNKFIIDLINEEDTEYELPEFSIERYNWIDLEELEYLELNAQDYEFDDTDYQYDTD